MEIHMDSSNQEEGLNLENETRKGLKPRWRNMTFPHEACPDLSKSMGKNSVHLTYQITWQWHRNYMTSNISKPPKPGKPHESKQKFLIFYVILFLVFLMGILNFI